MTYFIHYNLWVIRRAIKDLHAYLAKQQQRISDAAQLLRSSPDLNHRQQSLIYHALKHPDFLYTIEQHKRTHNISYGTARSDLIGLTDIGYLEMAHQGKKLVFDPHGELLEKLKKLSPTPGKRRTSTRLNPPPVAVTHVQT